MTVHNKIENDLYVRLINYAFKKADAVMFVSRKDGFTRKDITRLDKTIFDTKQLLKSSFLKSRNGSYWVFMKVGYAHLGIGKDPDGFQQLFEVLFYETSDEVKEYLLTNRNLYNWLNPKYPEDLAFFKDGYCWLYSVAHEEMCEIYCEDKEEYEYLKSIGIEFWEKEFVPTPREDLYFENYQ